MNAPFILHHVKPDAQNRIHLDLDVPPDMHGEVSVLVCPSGTLPQSDGVITADQLADWVRRSQSALGQRAFNSPEDDSLSHALFAAQLEDDPEEDAHWAKYVKN